jgi:hypothetical protein
LDHYNCFSEIGSLVFILRINRTFFFQVSAVRGNHQATATLSPNIKTLGFMESPLSHSHHTLVCSQDFFPPIASGARPAVMAKRLSQALLPELILRCVIFDAHIIIGIDFLAPSYFSKR